MRGALLLPGHELALESCQPASYKRSSLPLQHSWACWVKHLLHYVALSANIYGCHSSGLELIVAGGCGLVCLTVLQVRCTRYCCGPGSIYYRASVRDA